jgi:hypothetical protein
VDLQTADGKLPVTAELKSVLEESENYTYFVKIFENLNT